LTTYTITGDSGHAVHRAFCKDCGSRIYGLCENPIDSKSFEGRGAITVGIGCLDISAGEIDAWNRGKEYYEEQRVLVHI
jgi:hypothetical protein